MSWKQPVCLALYLSNSKKRQLGGGALEVAAVAPPSGLRADLRGQTHAADLSGLAR